MSTFQRNTSWKNLPLKKKSVQYLLLLFARQWPVCGFSWNFRSEARRLFQTLSVPSQVVTVMVLVTHTIGLASESPLYRPPWWLSSEKSPCQCRRRRRHGFDPWVRKIPGGGNGESLQYSRLGNPMGRGDWWATIHQELGST